MRGDIYLRFLGRGAAFNPVMENTSAWFSINGTFYLIDAGETVFGKIWDKDEFFSAERIAVILTHMHADHVGSLGTLISYSTIVLGKSVEIYYPSDNLEPYLDYVGIGMGSYIHFLESPSSWDISIVSYPVPHAENMDCFGYVIRREGFPIVYYSGDAGDVPEAVLKGFLSKDIEYIFQDTSMKANAHHCYIGKLKDCFPRETRNRVYCMHLSHPNCVPSLREMGFNVVEVSNE